MPTSIYFINYIIHCWLSGITSLSYKLLNMISKDKPTYVHMFLSNMKWVRAYRTFFFLLFPFSPGPAHRKWPAPHVSPLCLFLFAPFLSWLSWVFIAFLHSPSSSYSSTPLLHPFLLLLSFPSCYFYSPWPASLSLYTYHNSPLSQTRKNKIESVRLFLLSL